MSNLSIKPQQKNHHRTTKGLKEWTRLRVICWYFNWIVTFVATVVCMIPLFAYGEKQREGYPVGDFAFLQKFSNGSTLTNVQIKALTDDGTFSVDSYQLILISALNMGCALPSTMDLLVDIFVALTEKEGEKSSSQDIVRLSLLERAAFLFGVLCNGAYLFFPPTWNIMLVANVNNVFNNYSAFIQVVPITIFLERSTHAFTPLWTSFLVLTLALSESIWCMTYVGVTHAQFLQMDVVNIVCYGVSTWGTLLTILWCFVTTMRQYKWGEGFGMRENVDGSVLSVYEDFNTNRVPALHMTALAISLIVCFVWYYLLAAITFEQSNLLNTLFILAACLVMVIEMRVRANEVREGLDKIELVQQLKNMEKAEKDKEKSARLREEQLTIELNENIASSAHDMKSPACALSLAVDSLVGAFYGKTHIDKNGCHMTLVTLTGMMQSLSALNIIINRSVDAANKMSGNSLKANMGLIEIRKLLDDVVVFMRWQAEGTSLVIALEPVPDLVPSDISADLKWLREDLMCVAANALKFSRERFLVPVVVRVTIDTNEKNNDEPMLCFTFIDSGRNLSNDRLLQLFDHPMTLSKERLGMGGRGLGLYCLRERVTAVGGRCGARVRRDGLEGTEVWFCIPMLHAHTDAKSFELPNRSSPILQDSSSQLKEMGKNAAALENPSSYKSTSSEFVTVLGGSRRLSSSNSKDSMFVHNKTNPLSNRNTSNGMGNAAGSGTTTLNKGAYNALVSNKHKVNRSSMNTSSIGSARKSTDISPIDTRRSSRDHGVLRSTKSSVPEPSISLTMESIRNSSSSYESPKYLSAGACNVLLSTKMNPPQQASMKSSIESARKSTEQSPHGSRRPSRDQNILSSNESSNHNHPSSQPQPSNKSSIESVRQSPADSRRSSRDHSTNTAKIFQQQPVRLSSKSSIESGRKSTDTSPILSPRMADDVLRDEALRIVSQKSLDRSSMDVAPLASVKPSLDQVNEDLGLGALPILIVDDSITILKMIKRSILNELPDLVIKEARDGHEAFDRVMEETNGFHVIITDIQMPECNGFDFTPRTRKKKSLATYHDCRNVRELSRKVHYGISISRYGRFYSQAFPASNVTGCDQSCPISS